MRSFSFLTAAPLLFAVGCGSASATIDSIDMATGSSSTTKPGTVILSLSNCAIQGSTTPAFSISNSNGILFSGDRITEKNTNPGSKQICVPASAFINSLTEKYKCDVGGTVELSKLMARGSLYSRVTSKIILPTIASSEGLLSIHASAYINDSSRIASVVPQEVFSNLGSAAPPAVVPSIQHVSALDKLSVSSGISSVSVNFAVLCAASVAGKAALEGIIPKLTIEKIEISDSPDFPQNLPM